MQLPGRAKTFICMTVFIYFFLQSHYSPNFGTLSHGGHSIITPDENHASSDSRAWLLLLQVDGGYGIHHFAGVHHDTSNMHSVDEYSEYIVLVLKDYFPTKSDLLELNHPLLKSKIPVKHYQ